MCTEYNVYTRVSDPSIYKKKSLFHILTICVANIGSVVDEFPALPFLILLGF